MIKETLKKYIHYIIIFLLSVTVIFSVGKCVSDTHYLQNQMEHNVKALSDSVKYYKTKTGEVVAQKEILIGDIKLLELTNKELYDKINSMEVKKPQTVVQVNSTIDMGKKDTVFVGKDSIYNFDFSNEFRQLSGNIKTYNNLVSLAIEKDIVNADYTLALKDGKVFLNSDNPYIKFNEIKGLTIATPKQKRWGIGPSISFGYDPINNKPSFNVGISLSYQLIKF